MIFVLFKIDLNEFRFSEKIKFQPITSTEMSSDAKLQEQLRYDVFEWV